MYSLNFYPEYLERRKESRKRVFKTAAVAMLSGLIFFSIGSLVLSAIIINGRLSLASSYVAEQNSRIASQTALETELLSLREMLDIRAQRIDWAPKLAMLSEKMHEDLQIVDFDGCNDRGKKPKKLTILGESRNKDLQISVFTEFVDILSIDPRLSNDFANLRLGSVGGGAGNGFQIIGDDSEGGS